VAPRGRSGRHIVTELVCPRAHRDHVPRNYPWTLGTRRVGISRLGLPILHADRESLDFPAQRGHPHHLYKRIGQVRTGSRVSAALARHLLGRGCFHERRGQALPQTGRPRPPARQTAGGARTFSAPAPPGNPASEQPPQLLWAHCHRWLLPFARLNWPSLSRSTNGKARLSASPNRRAIPALHCAGR